MSFRIESLNPPDRQELSARDYELNPEDRLSQMPDLVLEKIIYHLVFDTEGWVFFKRVYSRRGYHALGLVNRRMNDFVFKDPHARGVFVKALLDRCRSLSISETDFRINLTLESLKIGFKLYLDDPNNEFSKMVRLGQEIQTLAFDLFKKAKEIYFSPSISFRVTHFIGKDCGKLEDDGGG